MPRLAIVCSSGQSLRRLCARTWQVQTSSCPCSALVIDNRWFSSPYNDQYDTAWNRRSISKRNIWCAVSTLNWVTFRSTRRERPAKSFANTKSSTAAEPRSVRRMNRPFGRYLASAQSAGDVDDRASDVGGVIRQQPHHRLRDLFCSSRPPHGHRGTELGDPVRHTRRCVYFGVDHSRAYRVDADAVLGDLGSGADGEGIDRPLGSRIVDEGIRRSG